VYCVRLCVLIRHVRRAWIECTVGSCTIVRSWSLTSCKLKGAASNFSFRSEEGGGRGERARSSPCPPPSSSPSTTHSHGCTHTHTRSESSSIIHHPDLHSSDLDPVLYRQSIFLSVQTSLLTTPLSLPITNVIDPGDSYEPYHPYSNAQPPRN
jgi:hypothetical protein